jgi:hypothetical protein
MMSLVAISSLVSPLGATVGLDRQLVSSLVGPDQSAPMPTPFDWKD